MATTRFRPSVRLAGLAAPVVLVAAGCGDHGGDHAEDTADQSAAAAPTRWVEVTMTENAFTPDRIEVMAGERIRFRFVNEGAVVHEALIGSEAEQAEHEATMAEEMGDDHGDHHGAVVVQPGETKVTSEVFDEPGTVLIGCHQPGHYEAGMQATVAVS